MAINLSPRAVELYTAWCEKHPDKAAIEILALQARLDEEARRHITEDITRHLSGGNDAQR